MTGLTVAGDLLDQLLCRMASGFGIAGIDRQDLRVEKLHQRRAADAGKLETIDSLLLEILAGPSARVSVAQTSALVSADSTSATLS